jgi:predicted  nucleic acid-binding Zn-ribbon protein
MISKTKPVRKSKVSVLLSDIKTEMRERWGWRKYEVITNAQAIRFLFGRMSHDETEIKHLNKEINSLRRNIPPEEVERMLRDKVLEIEFLHNENSSLRKMLDHAQDRIDKLTMWGTK